MRILLSCLAILIGTPELLAERVLDDGKHHLGDSVVKDWKDVPAKPEGTSLTLKFAAKPNAVEHVLSLVVREVNHAWHVRINGKLIGVFDRTKKSQVKYFAIPAGLLKDGDNRLEVKPSNPSDDIVIGNIKLYDKALVKVLNLGRLHVTVVDAASKQAAPARLTIINDKGQKAKLISTAVLRTAVRPGVFYTYGDGADVLLPAGSYTVYAMRSVEWSMDVKKVEVSLDEPASAAFSLKRELDTKGRIACDTHIHTLTYSGHGDSSVEERMLTLAAEGVELAIATDHNHHTDYSDVQSKMGLNDHFTPVIGNEVTTKLGHFNAFPFKPGVKPPPHQVKDWVKLVQGMRDAGAKVVILNHPRWPDAKKNPLTVHGLDRKTGVRKSGTDYTFDGMELVNSGTMQADPLYLFVDWFALLTYGDRIWAVGSSDSHTVGDIVGQARTYVPSATDDPAKIDVDAACKQFLEGRVSVSLGIIADIRVDGQYRSGDTIKADRPLDIDLRVQAPSWVRPRRALIFANGKQVAEIPVPVTEGQPTDVRLKYTLPKQQQDTFLVAVVLGDQVKSPAWRIEKPYTLAATNPLFLDIDGDGYTPPRKQKPQSK